MVFALLLLNICAGIAIIGGFFYAKNRVRRYTESLINAYNSLVTCESGEEASKLEQIVDYAAHIFAKRLLSTSNAVSMQQSSVDARLTKQLERDIAEDTINLNHPLAGLVLDQMPAVKKTLLKNPRAIQLLLPMIEKMKAGAGAQDNAGGNGHNSNVAKRLREL